MKTLIIYTIFTLSSSLFRLSAQSWEWGQQGFGNGEGFAVASNPAGDAFLTGYFVDSLIFGTNVLYSKQNREIFLVKYDNTGNAHWAIQSYSTKPAAYEYSLAVSTDDSGNSFITGQIYDSVKLGTYTLVAQPNAEMFLAKIDSLGNVIWAKQSGGFVASEAAAYGVISDKHGNFYVTGYFNDTTYIGSIKLQTLPHVQGVVFIAKYSSNGNTLWAKQASVNPGNFGGIGYATALDVEGNVFITGIFSDTIFFGSTTLIGNNAGYCVFLVKYDSNGNFKWAKQSQNLLANHYTYGYSVVTDKYGSIYVTGAFQDTIYFDSFKLYSPVQDIFLTKYDSSGKVLWAKAAVVLDNDRWIGYSLACDDSNYIYLSGGKNLSNPANLKFGNLTFNISNSKDAAVLIKFDTSGNALCGSILPSGGEDNNGIACSPSGQFIYLGTDLWNDTIIFGQDTLKVIYEEPIVASWQGCKTTEGILVVLNLQKAELMPNPNNGIFKVLIANNNNDIIELYNIFGEIIYTCKLNPHETEFNLIGASSGIYFYRIIQDDKMPLYSGKFIIQR